MNNWPNRIHVLKSIVTGQDKTCPYCGSGQTFKIGRNAPLSHVRECSSCRLIFRWPKQDLHFNASFYQKAYSKFQRSPVTDLPSGDEIEFYKKNNFKDSPRDFSHYTCLFQKLGCQRVLDYGCSWGYGVFQFQSAGMDAEGLEVSVPRATYGREQLGVTIHSTIDAVLKSGKKFDLIFTSHVWEHLPDPKIALDFFERVCADSGYLVIEVPNCGGTKARELGLQWGPFSSSIHPLSYTLEFFRNALGKHNFVLTGAPEKKDIASLDITQLDSGAYLSSQVDGDDLVVICRKI